MTRPDHFGLLAPFYERFIRPKAPERLLELLEPAPDGTVLDAGGGTGRVSQFLSGHTRSVLVVDESMQMLREATKKPGLHAICAHAEALPFGEGSLDRVIMVDALHHVRLQSATAQELWRVLKPGGRIVIEEPDVRTFAVKLIALGEKLALMRSRFLTPPQIAGLFAYTGASAATEQDGPTAWVIVEKMLARGQGTGRGKSPDEAAHRQ